MIRWSLAFILTMGSIVVLLGPDPSIEQWSDDTLGPDPTNRSYQYLVRYNERNAIEQRLMMIDWRDELSGRAIEAHESGERVAIEATEATDPRYVDNLRLAVESIDRGQDVALGVFGFAYGSEEDTRESFGGTHPLHTVMAGTRDEQTYCISFQPYSARRGTQGRFPTPKNAGLQAAVETLGACFWVFRYGMPGEGMLEWMNQGGMEYLRNWSRPAYQPNNSVGSLRGEAMSCLEGWLDACTRDFEARRVADNDEWSSRFGLAPISYWDGTFGSRTHNGMLFRNLSSTMMAELEREFGVDAFQEFWSSDAEVTEAFEATFGIGAAEWVSEWGNRYYGDRRSTPLPDRADLFSVLAFMLVGLLVGARTGIRRTIS